MLPSRCVSRAVNASKCVCGRGSALDPAGGAYATAFPSPYPLARFGDKKSVEAGAVVFLSHLRSYNVLCLIGVCNEWRTLVHGPELIVAWLVHSVVMYERW